MDYANPTAKLRNYYKILTIKHILRSRADAFYRISPLLSHLRPNQARYSLLISLDSNFRTASDDQWNSFYRDYACIQAQSIFCRLGYMPQYLIRSQDLTLISVADAHGREHPMNQHKPKVASYSIPFHRGILTCQRKIAGRHKIFHNLPQKYVDPWLYLETESYSHQKNSILYHRIHRIIKRIGHVGVLDAYNPIMISPFRLFVYYRVKQFAFYHILCRRKADVHNIRRIARYLRIIFYGGNYVYVIRKIFPHCCLLCR